MEMFTIGYGNRSIHDFLSLLTKYGITCLVDVRSIPYSKFHVDFRKENLEAGLRAQQISYGTKAKRLAEDLLILLYIIAIVWIMKS